MNTMAKKQKMIVTGGCGFIGSHFIRLNLAEDNNTTVVNIDKMTYAGKLSNTTDFVNNPRYQFVKADICDVDAMEDALVACDIVVHFASESHVDRSIHTPQVFVQTNVVGTQVLLSAFKKYANPGALFIYISTDEVYGSLPIGVAIFTEADLLKPSSPYSASKAAAEMIVQGYTKTHGINAVITRCANNYGTHQDHEKLIPRFINNLIQNKQLPVYGDGLNEREWISVRDHCKGILRIIKAKNQRFEGEIFNIGSGEVFSNMEITQMLLEEMGRDESLITYVNDRLGHDRRYAMDSERFKNKFSWKNEDSLRASLSEIIAWYKSSDNNLLG